MINKVLQNIKPSDKEELKKAKEYLDLLAKPPGSLGNLEDICAKLKSINKTLIHLDKRCVLIFAADNGVVIEGVASSPQSITAIQAINILNGLTGVSVLAKQFNTDLIVVDVGVSENISHSLLIDKKICFGTKNMVNSPAMSRDEAILAINIGIETVEFAKSKGHKGLGVGEMGIGNTTTSSAVLAILLNIPLNDLSKIVGRGAGLLDEAYKKKIDVIKKAITFNSPKKDDVIDILSKVGGFDICAMTGAFIGSAYYGLPVVIDGFISAVSALCAIRLNPTIIDYIFPSHKSFERGYSLAIEALGLSPVLDLNMRLGEGSGCPIMFSIMDASLAIINNMATFEEANINTDYLKYITKNNAF